MSEWPDVAAAGDLVRDDAVRPAAIRDAAASGITLARGGREMIEYRQVERIISESQERFWLTFSEAPIGIALVAPNGRWLAVNQAVCEIVGYDEAALLAASFQDITHPQDLDADLALVEQMLRGEIEHYRLDKRYLHRDGHVVPIQLDVSLVRETDGTPKYFVSHIQDISERQRYEQLLSGEKERFRVALSSIADAVIITATDGRVDFTNRAAQNMLQLPGEAMAGMHLSEVLRLTEDGSPEIHPELLHALQEQATSLVQGSAALQRADAPPIVVDYDLAPLQDPQGAAMGYVVSLHDVSQARALTSALEYQATHDALTGLLNRVGFERALEQQRRRARASGRRWSLVYLDLDRFKTVNDTAGHAVGDELLRAVAGRLRDALRSTDVLARLGGDEFGVILDRCVPEDCERIANKLIETVDQFRFDSGGRQFQLGMSAGLASGDGDTTPTDLLRMADTACYVAKRTGRNRACTFREDGIEGISASAEFDVLHELNRALDDRRLQVYAQKIVDVATRRTVGIELLMRLVTPGGKVLTPDRFLPVAERHGLITRLDSYMIARAAQLLGGELGPLPADWFVTVNVSGLSISDPRFHRMTGEVFSSDAHLRDRICFEITESAAPSNWAATRQGIELLRLHGARVLLDDFGSGFTSFNYLRNLQVDGLKIAQDFTGDISGDPINEPVVSLVSELSRRLNICTIAEGIEDERALQMVASKGIAMAQGYFFHRPEPVERLLAAA